MSPRQVTTVFAVLALGAAALTVAVVAVAIAARRSDHWRDRLGAFRDRDGSTALLAAAIIALVATGGSLYLSEVADFPPCRLCWYQRIAAYPLGPILLLAWWRRDHGIRPYVWLVCAIGGAISTYHVLLERFPSLETGACEVDNPCSIKWVEKFGFLTIPGMAWITFATVAALTWLAGPAPEHDDTASVPTPQEA